MISKRLIISTNATRYLNPLLLLQLLSFHPLTKEFHNILHCLAPDSRTRFLQPQVRILSNNSIYLSNTLEPIILIISIKLS